MPELQSVASAKTVEVFELECQVGPVFLVDDIDLFAICTTKVAMEQHTCRVFLCNQTWGGFEYIVLQQVS